MGKFTLIVVAAALIIAFFWARRKKQAQKIGQYEQRLRKRCYGDTALVERLINLELKRNPNLSREIAAKDAHASLLRDNR